MRFIEIVGIIVIIGIVLNSYYPDTYDSTFGQATTKLQSLWDSTDKKVDTSLHQEVLLPDGTVVAAEPGTIYGQCYDYFPCKTDLQCHRFSITAKCDIESGECYEPEKEK